MKNKINSFIICGGKSKRMGFDKLFIKIRGKSLISLIVENMKKKFKKVYIISNDNNKFSDFKSKKTILIEDEIKGIGPIGGLYTGLKNTDTEYNFVISGDIPYIDLELINNLIKNIDNKHNAFIYKYKRNLYPLFGIYSIKIIKKIEKCIANKNYSMNNLLRIVKTKVFPINDDKKEISFINLNTKKDLDNFLIKYNKDIFRA
jgi:molybdopterin-guanine dinucleotide biosynthesis protein A